LPAPHITVDDGEEQKLQAGQSDCWTDPGGQFDPNVHWAIVDASTQYFSFGHKASEVDPTAQKCVKEHAVHD
jgi:hypothetical protein